MSPLYLLGDAAPKVTKCLFCLLVIYCVLEVTLLAFVFHRLCRAAMAATGRGDPYVLAIARLEAVATALPAEWFPKGQLEGHECMRILF